MRKTLKTQPKNLIIISPEINIPQNIKNTTTGLKISGGIKSKVQAEHFAKLATEKSGHSDIDKTWFRIGASSLLAKLTNQR